VEVGVLLVDCVGIIGDDESAKDAEGVLVDLLLFSDLLVLYSGLLRELVLLESVEVGGAEGGLEHLLEGLFLGWLHG
jgi:hypothetical protein